MSILYDIVMLPTKHYFDWEKAITWEHYGPTFYAHWWFPVVLSVIYVAFVFGGQAYMKSRPAVDGPTMKFLLSAWNLFLAVLSWAMAIRLVPLLVDNLVTKGIKASVCDNSYTNAPAGVWVLIFCASKAPELLDTVFLVLRKKPVIVLHWYHHWSVLIYAWSAYALRIPVGQWFQALNATVHSFMYFYYFLTSRGYRPSWNLLLTLGQIIQMVIGTAIAVNDLVNYRCSNYWNSVFGLIMYFSYFVLFVKLFVDMYCKPGGKGKRGPKDGKPVEKAE